MKKQLVRWLVARNFYLAKFYQDQRLSRESAQLADKILIYQMGKVGSTSLYETLKSTDLNAAIYHLHFLQPAAVKRITNHYKSVFKKSHTIDQHVIHSQYLRRQLDRGFDHSPSKWKIITLVRDPVARNLSSFFHELRYQPDFPETESLDDSVIESLTKQYFQHYPYQYHPFDWFDSELRPVFGIDLFSTEFPHAKGYKIYTYDHVDLLILKLDKLGDCAQVALNEFLHIGKVLLRRANKGTQSKSGDLYKKFKQQAILPTAYLDTIYQSPKVKHFYSQAEIDDFYFQWTQSADS
ncbi:MAG: putative capsular polysaccharide synthesis family protein [Cyanobacteria bacterium P01_G01_bin.38]